MEQDKPMETIEVTWPVDDTTVYGSLIRPGVPGPFTSVVLVAGSGPTDRDWNSPLIPGTNGSGRLIAEALAEDGIASMRYDKRASGPHAAEAMRSLAGKIGFQSHVDELTGAVRTLARQTFTDPSRIFALTNSEGALHALNYQLHDPIIPFAGLVLIAPPGRATGVVGRTQVVAQLSGLPNAAELLAGYDAAIERFLAGEPVTPDPALPQGVQMLLLGLSNPANQPFARELWVTNAADWLAQVDVPVLVIIGKKDVQIDWQIDGQALEQAVAGHRNVAFVYPENANHVMKHLAESVAALSPAELIAGYNGPDTRLDPEGLDAIRLWFAAQA